MSSRGRRHLSKIFSHCCNKGIYLAKGDRAVTSDTIFKDVKGYGPLGAVVRQNFTKEWQYSCVTTSTANVHLIHFANHQQDFDSNHRLKLLDNNAIKFPQPFGLAYLSSNDTSESDSICLEYYCTNLQHWVVHWQRQRLKWWKRFSRSPEKFILESEGNATLNIKYVSEESDELLIESINSYSSITNNTSLININTMLDTGIWSILTDAFLDNNRQWDSQEPNALLQIHRRLAPVKVGILPQEDSSDLKLFCDRLTSELNLVDLSASCYKEGTVEMRLKHLDEIGTPSRVLLNDNTLTNGVVYLQDRDSGLSEPIESESLLNAIQKMYQRFKDFT